VAAPQDEVDAAGFPTPAREAEPLPHDPEQQHGLEHSEIEVAAAAA